MATIAIGVSPKAGGGSTATVPLSALEQDGVPPEEGDTVSFSVDATVQSVSGGNATLKIDAVNGEPVGGAENEPEEEAEPEEEGQQPPAPAAGGGPSGPASGADGIGRPLGAAPARPANRTMTSKGMPTMPGMPRTSSMPMGSMKTSTGETVAQMGKRLRKAAKAQPLF